MACNKSHTLVLSIQEISVRRKSIWVSVLLGVGHHNAKKCGNLKIKTEAQPDSTNQLHRSFNRNRSEGPHSLTAPTIGARAPALLASCSKQAMMRKSHRAQRLP